jgi:hypothetical protein
MMSVLRFMLVLGLGIVAATGAIKAQEANFSLDDRITPEKLGLPDNCTRTSEPFVTRIYKTDAADRILKLQPEGYLFTIKVHLTLGEFWTHRDASNCAIRWSEDHPNYLRLTREREVPLSPTGK